MRDAVLKISSIVIGEREVVINCLVISIASRSPYVCFSCDRTSDFDEAEVMLIPIFEAIISLNATFSTDNSSLKY